MWPMSPSTGTPKCATGRVRLPTPSSPACRTMSHSSSSRARRQVLDRDGPEGLARWMKAQPRCSSPTRPCATRTRALLATRMRVIRYDPHRQAYPRGLPNLFRSSAGAARPSTWPCASSTRTRGSACEAVRAGCAQHPDADAAARLERGRLHQLSRQRGEVLRRARQRRAASMSSASSIASTGSRTCAFRSTRWLEAGKVCRRRRSAIPATCSTPTGPSMTSKYYVGLAKELQAAGAHVLGLKDMAGLLKPRRRAKARRGAKAGSRPADPPPHPRYLAAPPPPPSSRRSKPVSTRLTRRWMRCSGTTSQPTLGSIAAALKDTPRGPRARSARRSARSRSTGKRCATQYCGLRERPEGRRLGSLPARNARRAVHKPQGTGALARP